MGIPFGRYELLKRIAAGGMGEVFLARQAGIQGFEKLLVVKVLLPHLVEDEEFINMFLDEARIAARLNHPNIAQIYDLDQVEGAYYIAMEYVHGEDVVRIWKTARGTESPVPLPLAVRIAADAAAGLDYAHKAVDSSNQPLNIVHRDVSPQNILVTFDGGVKLIDFGVAKAAGRSSKTATGTLKGKYSYMSPEQASGGAVDHRSDVFALGVVLFEMATSVRLFKRDTEIATLKAVTECRIPQPSQCNPAIDPQLEAVILKALARDPAERYQDAQAFRMALEDWMVQTRQSGSAAHLGAFMQRIFAERLSAERAEGRPFSDFEGTPSAVFRNPSATLRSRPPAPSGSFIGAVPPPDARTVEGITEPAVPTPPSPAVVPAPAAPQPNRAVMWAAFAVAGALLLAGVAVLVAGRGGPAPQPQPQPEVAAPTLSVRTLPAGAVVRVDGAEVGVTPLDGYRLAPGRNAQVEVRLDGYQPIRRSVPAVGSQSLDFQLVAEAAPQVPAATPVSLQLASQPPGATVLLGDRVLGTTPMVAQQPRSDVPLTLQFRLAGHRPASETFVPDQDREVRATLAKLPAKQTPANDPLEIKTGR